MKLLPRCLILFFLSVFLCAAAELINITAESGQSVSLSCKAQNSNPVTFMEWSKNGLKKGYLLLYRDERFDPENQHPAFKNRVVLQDTQMKDGDVSLILKDVRFDDQGTYECRVETQVNRRKRANQGDDPIRTIYLVVVAPPGQPGGTTEDGGKKDEEDGGKEEGGKEEGSVGLIVGLSVAALLLVATVGFVIYRKPKEQQSGGSYQPPAEQHHV